MIAELPPSPALAEAARRNRAARLAQIAKLRPLVKSSYAEAEELRQRRKGTEEVRKEVETVAGLAHVPDFFPTPRSLVARMVEWLAPLQGLSALEPSAGKGDIAKALAAAGAQVSVCEINYTMRGLLSGFTQIGMDFLEVEPCPFDVVAMNPPFSGLADIRHVRHAFKFLKPGGRLIAIMSESPFFRDCREASEFRDWLDQIGGESERLPADTFSSAESYRSTSVNTRLVTIQT